MLKSIYWNCSSMGKLFVLQQISFLLLTEFTVFIRRDTMGRSPLRVILSACLLLCNLN